MALTLAERSRLIAPSATMAMAAQAKKLKGEGVDVLDFSLGEPDFPTPENIQEAAIKAMREGKTHYTPAPGVPELRQCVADWYGQLLRAISEDGERGGFQRRQARDSQCA